MKHNKLTIPNSTQVLDLTALLSIKTDSGCSQVIGETSGSSGRTRALRIQNSGDLLMVFLQGVILTVAAYLLAAGLGDRWMVVGSAVVTLLVAQFVRVRLKKTRRPASQMVMGLVAVHAGIFCIGLFGTSDLRREIVDQAPGVLTASLGAVTVGDELVASSFPSPDNSAHSQLAGVVGKFGQPPVGDGWVAKTDLSAREVNAEDDRRVRSAERVRAPRQGEWIFPQEIELLRRNGLWLDDTDGVLTDEGPQHHQLGRDAEGYDPAAPFRQVRKSRSVSDGVMLAGK